MTVAQSLAERILAIDIRTLPERAIYWTNMSILDTIGVAFAGANDAGVAIADKVTTGGASRGPSLILGTSRRAPALDAALINGMAAHVLDFDCSSPVMGGHPAVQLLPAIFALAEMIDADGASLTAAYAAGAEIQSRIGRGLQPKHFNVGWFPTSTIGIFGAAAGAAHMLRLDRDQTAQALGLAAQFACGGMANSGTMTKPLSAGHTARAGLMAALLVKEGFSASIEAMEDRRGFFTLFNGAGNFDIDAMLADGPLDLVKSGVAFKQYPCCGIAAAPVDLFTSLLADNKLGIDDIDNVDVLLHARRLGHVNRPNPRSEIDAKFSIHYCLAVTALHGRPRLEDFEGDAYHEAEARKFMPRVRPAADPALDESVPLGEDLGADIRIATKNGKIVSGRIVHAFGRDPENPLPQAMLEAKFIDCAARVLSVDAANRLLDLLRNVDRAPSVRELAQFMSPEGATSPDAKQKPRLAAG